MDQIDRHDPLSEHARQELFRTGTVMEQADLINHLVASLLLKVRGSGNPVIVCHQSGISDEPEPVIDLLLVELHHQIAQELDVVVIMDGGWIILLARPSPLGN